MFAVVTAWAGISAGNALGQEPNTGPSPATASEALTTKSASEEHRFWDKEHYWLFAGVGTSRTLDYFSTLNFRRRGRQEIFFDE